MKTTVILPLAPVRIVIIAKIRNNAGIDMENRESLCTGWWDCMLVPPLWKTLMEEMLKKLKTDLPYDPAVSLLEIYAKITKTLTWKDICISMILSPFFFFFLVVKTRKPPKCLSTDKWINKICYIHTIEYYSFVKWGNSTMCDNMRGLWRHWIKWDKDKYEYNVISLVCGILKQKTCLPSLLKFLLCSTCIWKIFRPLEGSIDSEICKGDFWVYGNVLFLWPHYYLYRYI